MVVLTIAEKSIQLIPDGTMVLHVVVILVMVGVLKLTLYRPLNRIFDERDRETEGRLRDVLAILASVEMKQSLYKRRVRETRAKGYQFVEQERTRALVEREDRLRALKGEMRNWAVERKALIERQKEEVRRELEVEARRAGVRLASQILSRPMKSGGSEPTT
jgi:F-type H+-transporting ATPase subunit b